MTLTQEPQPYGPLVRQEVTINGTEYEVRRGPAMHHVGVQYSYRLAWKPGCKPRRTLGVVHVWERETTALTMGDAVDRIRGVVEANQRV